MKAYELIDAKTKFLDDAFAKDVDGRIVSWRSTAAVQFDLLGAIHHVYHGQDLAAVYEQLYRTKEMVDGKSLPYYNKQWGWELCYNFLFQNKI